jgi:hypothetical protein
MSTPLRLELFCGTLRRTCTRCPRHAPARSLYDAEGQVPEIATPWRDSRVRDDVSSVWVH